MIKVNLDEHIRDNAKVICKGQTNIFRLILLEFNLHFFDAASAAMVFYQLWLCLYLPTFSTTHVLEICASTSPPYFILLFVSSEFHTSQY